MSTPIRVVVTGATGQVAYALLPRIASGEMFGPDTDIDLRLSDIPQMIDKAKGVLMELEDCAYPLLERVSASADRAETHDRADWVLLVGSVPRGPGMERGGLIRKNGPIFVEEGKAIQRYASSSARVVVVGNPCNTNCLIARANAHTIPDDRWSAMTRLDQNRARSLLAAKAGGRVRDVKKLAIWGNHSTTLYPDFTNAEVGGKPADQVVERTWLETEFIPAVQQRGGAVIAARGASSAFSAAQAIVDHVKSLVERTAGDGWFSAAVVSDGSYGVERGIVSSFPLRSKGDGAYEIVQGVKVDAFAKSKIDDPTVELRRGFVRRVEGSRGPFRVCLADGSEIASRRVLLATGVTDIIPEIAGLRELFGRSVHHCPHCDAFEYLGKPVAVYGSGAA